MIDGGEAKNHHYYNNNQQEGRTGKSKGLRFLLKDDVFG